MLEALIGDAVTLAPSILIVNLVAWALRKVIGTTLISVIRDMFSIFNLRRRVGFIDSVLLDCLELERQLKRAIITPNAVIIRTYIEQLGHKLQKKGSVLSEYRRECERLDPLGFKTYLKPNSQLLATLRRDVAEYKEAPSLEDHLYRAKLQTGGMRWWRVYYVRKIKSVFEGHFLLKRLPYSMKSRISM